MSNLNKYAVKIVREYIKKDYKARDCCYICGETATLELHHLYSLSETWNTWLDKQKIRHLESDDHVKQLRVQFAEDCSEQLSNKHLITLCKKHHLALHTVYGQRYSNHLVPKIRNWVEIQKDKHSG